MKSAIGTRYWAFVGLVALILALGRYTPASYVFYYLIPFFRIVRFPVKFFLPATLAVAQLAAIGSDLLLARWASGEREEATGKGLHSLKAVLLALAAAWLLASVALIFRWGIAVRAIEAFTALVFDHSRALAARQAIPLSRPELLQQASAWLMRAIPARLPYVLGTALLLAVVFSSRLRIPVRRRLVVVAGAVAILQLIGVHGTLNPLVNRRYFEDRPAIARAMEAGTTQAAGAMEAGATGFRIPVRVFAEPALNPPTLPSSFVSMDLGQVDFLPPAAHVYYAYRFSLQSGGGLLGLEGSFSADPEHILLQPQEALNHLVYDAGLAGEPLARLLRLAGVEYVALIRYPQAPGLEPAGTFPNGTTTPVRLYRIRDPLPRAYLVPAGGAIELPPGTPTISRLLAADFDPKQQLVLEPGAAANRAIPQSGTALSRAALLRRDALKVEVAADCRAPAYLVLTDSYNPDWQVKIDGIRTPLLRANQMFRAVALTAGTHRVVFEYRPLSFIWGGAITLATALLIVLFACCRRR